MNITPQTTALPLATVVNPQTDSLRRENVTREVITQPVALNQSAAEKGVASEKDRSRTPAENNQAIDFANLRKQAERDDASINGEGDNSGDNNDADQQQGQQSNSNAGDENPVEAFAEQKEINSLKKRDREVRSHESAHAAAGGPFTGAPSYSFEVGPDGKRYAVEGEVSVDLAPIDGNPRATIAKMQKVYAAALAPANPSVQDTRVAATAARLISQAQSDLVAQTINKEQENQSSSPEAIRPNQKLSENAKSSASDFDSFMNDTIAAQDRVTARQTLDSDVQERSLRIAGFYSQITQAYERPPRFQFEITA